MRREANDVMEMRSVEDNGDGATNGHDEGNEEKSEVVEGCDWFEKVGSKGITEGGMRKKISERKVGEDSEEQELRSGAKGVAWSP